MPVSSSTNRVTHLELRWYQMEYNLFVKSRGRLIKQAVQRVQRFLKHRKSINDVDQQFQWRISPMEPGTKSSTEEEEEE